MNTRKLPSIEPTFRGVAICVERHKTVLFDPVANRRCVLVRNLADRLKRHPLGQALLQKSLLHEVDIGKCLGQKTANVRSGR